jgi:ribose transport system substrate-binding protein
MVREHFGPGFGLVSGIGALCCLGLLGFSLPAIAADAKVDIGADITKMCGTKPIRVGIADGYGGNTWRKIVLAEIKDEAARPCGRI